MPENGSPITSRRAEVTALRSAATVRSAGNRRRARREPFRLDALLRGEVGHRLQLADRGRVVGVEHDQPGPHRRLLGVAPLQHVQQLGGALDEGQGVGAHAGPPPSCSGERSGGEELGGVLMRGPRRVVRGSAAEEKNSGGVLMPPAPALAGAEESATTPGDAAQLLHGRQLARVDLLDAVAERRLDDADVADQALAGRSGSTRGRLVGAPHGAVEGDVALDDDGAEGDRGQRGLQARLVAGVADGHVGVLGRRVSIMRRFSLFGRCTGRCWWRAAGRCCRCRAPRRRARSAPSSTCRWRG